MAIYENKEFKETTIFLDANSFHSCKFDRCTLVYQGGPIPEFNHCIFGKVEFYFDGPASNTLEILRVWLTMPGFREHAAAALGLESRPAPGSAGTSGPASTSSAEIHGKGART